MPYQSPGRHYLSDSEAALLKQLFDRYRNEIQTSNLYLPEMADEPIQTPDNYFARTPSGSIPKMVGSTPGSAQCDVYWLDTSGTPTFTLITELSGADAPTVYNIGPKIDGNKFINISREKAGSWYAPLQGVAGTGTGTFTETQELYLWVLTADLLPTAGTAHIGGFALGNTCDNPLGLSGLSGTNCVVAVDISGANDPYLLAVVEHQGSQMCLASLTADLHNSTTAVSVGSVTSITSEAAPTVTTATNPFGLAGSSGDLVLLIKNSSGGSPVYFISQVKHHVVSPVVDVTFVTPSEKEQKQDFVVMVDGAPKTATVVWTGVECTTGTGT